MQERKKSGETSGDVVVSMKGVTDDLRESRPLLLVQNIGAMFGFVMVSTQKRQCQLNATLPYSFIIKNNRNNETHFHYSTASVRPEETFGYIRSVDTIIVEIPKA